MSPPGQVGNSLAAPWSRQTDRCRVDSADAQTCVPGSTEKWGGSEEEDWEQAGIPAVTGPLGALGEGTGSLHNFPQILRSLDKQESRGSSLCFKKEEASYRQTCISGRCFN